VSWNKTANDPLANTTPVRPPNVNKKIKAKANNILGVKYKLPPNIVANQLKTLIAVGTAITKVAAEK